MAGEYDGLMQWAGLANALSSLGDMWTNKDRERRGLAPINSSAPIQQMMGLAQAQQKAAQADQARAAIAGAQGIPESVRPLLLDNPEAQAAYVRATMAGTDTSPKLYNTAAGLYDPANDKWITPPEGSGPQLNPLVKQIYQGNDVVTAAIDPRSGQIMQELARAPRWQPDNPRAAGGGGGGAGLAGKGLVAVQDADGNYVYMTKADAVGKAAPAPRTALPGGVTAAQQKELSALNQEQAITQGALDNINQDPSAFDAKTGNVLNLAGKLGEGVRSFAERQLLSPDQIQKRTLLNNQVSAIVHERAGSAQTESERTQLMKFLPSETDNVDQITAKLQGLKQYYALKRNALPGGTVGGAPASVTPQIVATPQAPLAPKTPTLAGPQPVPGATTKEQYLKLNSGDTYIDPFGVRRTKK